MSTKAELLACVDREIAFRRRVYPNAILAGRMKKDKADYEIARMVEIRGLLCSLIPDDQPPLFEPERGRRT